MSVCPKPAATDLHTVISRLEEELAETYVAQQDGTTTNLTINGAITLDEDAIASLCAALKPCLTPPPPPPPPPATDQGLDADYSGTGWYKATDTGIVYNKDISEGETHTFAGDPIKYISVYTKEDARTYAERAATSNITDMTEMFSYAYNKTNADISHWDVSNVVDMNDMFNGAVSFNQDISNWDVSNVNNMIGMFVYAVSFNQDISNWDVSNVVDMNGMFYGAVSFNQDISNWDVSNVVDMSGMFDSPRTSSFNQDLSQWCVSKITSKPSYFDDNATAWTLPRPVWGTCP